MSDDVLAALDRLPTYEVRCTNPETGKVKLRDVKVESAGDVFVAHKEDGELHVACCNPDQVPSIAMDLLEPNLIGPDDLATQVDSDVPVRNVLREPWDGVPIMLNFNDTSKECPVSRGKAEVRQRFVLSRWHTPEQDEDIRGPWEDGLSQCTAMCTSDVLRRIDNELLGAVLAHSEDRDIPELHKGESYVFVAFRHGPNLDGRIIVDRVTEELDDGDSARIIITGTLCDALDKDAMREREHTYFEDDDGTPLMYVFAHGEWTGWLDILEPMSAWPQIDAPEMACQMTLGITLQPEAFGVCRLESGPEDHTPTGGKSMSTQNDDRTVRPIESPWQRYTRKGFSEMRPYVPGEDLSGVSVSPEDTPQEGGMIARNPNNHDDKWYVNGEYFQENLQAVDECP